MFAVDGGSNDCFDLDSTSVVDTASPLVQLLENPGFDNSTGAFNGWNEWCGSTCTPYQGAAALAITSGCESGTCIALECGANPPTSGVVLLGQYFSATIGHVYNISFWLYYASGGPAGTIYVDVV